jgi:hypothetical protein
MQLQEPAESGEFVRVLLEGKPAFVRIPIVEMYKGIGARFSD